MISVSFLWSAAAPESDGDRPPGWYWLKRVGSKRWEACWFGVPTPPPSAIEYWREIGIAKVGPRASTPDEMDGGAPPPGDGDDVLRDALALRPLNSWPEDPR